MTSPLVASIVEGHGEVQSIRRLVSRIALEMFAVPYVDQPKPFRIPAGRMYKSDEITRAIALARSRLTGGREGGVLVVRDADDETPQVVSARIRKACVGAEAEIVIANREFEAWFLAGRGRADCEVVRDAKGAVSAVVDRSYRPTLDQARLVETLDLVTARSLSPSFVYLVEAVGRLVRGR